jgi:hypothetical protein
MSERDCRPIDLGVRKTAWTRSIRGDSATFQPSLVPIAAPRRKAVDRAVCPLVPLLENVCNQRLRFALDLRQVLLAFETFRVQFVDIFRT